MLVFIDGIVYLDQIYEAVGVKIDDDI